MSITVDKIDIKTWTYPAGERGMSVSQVPLGLTETSIWLSFEGSSDIVDLINIMDFLNVNNIEVTELIMPYFPFSRQDREIVTHADAVLPFSLRGFVGLLESLGIQRIVTMDLHSEAARRVSSIDIVNIPQAVFLEPLIRDVLYSILDVPKEKIAVLFPDAGASLKARTYSGLQSFYAVKSRDTSTGFVTTSLPSLPASISDVIIVDDICDGGATFVGIANLLPKGVSPHLVVTHGIFSKGKQVLFDAGFKTIKSAFTVGAN